MVDVTWTCKCGAVEARVPTKGNRIVCYCESCRAFVSKLDAKERLNAQGGSELLQTKPQDVTITKGVEHLVHMHLTPKGPLRWYTRCCGTPMANTLTTRSLPFASFQVHDLEPKNNLPAFKGVVNLGGATGHVENAKRASVLALIASILGGAATAYLSGTVKKNPFFDPSGAPIGPRQDPA